MSELDRLERDLTVWFAETGVPRTPPYLDDILRQTALRGQRPRWTFLERLLPMSTTTSFRAARAGVPWRPLAAVVLLIVALLVTVLVVGSAQQRLPVPFGPAAAGLVAYSADGDIFVAHPATGDVRPIVTGASADTDPRWSRDGSRIVFERAESGLMRLFTVRPDGSELRSITPTRIYIQDNTDGPRYTFSPDGRSVLFVANSVVQIARTDGSGVTTLDTAPELLAKEAAWRPPDGSQIAVLGQYGALHLVEIATGSTRTLVPPDTAVDAAGLRWSPDGSEITYYPWLATADKFTVRARIVDIVSGVSRRADPHGNNVFWDASAVWSNDGERLAIARGYADAYADVTVAIFRADGTGPRVETAHGLALIRECCAPFEWAPDDSRLLVTPADAAGNPTAQVMIDPDTGTITTPPWQTASDPAWQRLAP